MRQVVIVFTNATQLTSQNRVFVEVKNKVLSLGRSFRNRALPESRAAMVEVQSFAGLAKDISMADMREEGVKEYVAECAGTALRKVTETLDAYRQLLDGLGNSKREADAETARLTRVATAARQEAEGHRAGAIALGVGAALVVGAVCPPLGAAVLAAEEGAGLLFAGGVAAGALMAAAGADENHAADGRDAHANQALSEEKVLSVLMKGISEVHQELECLMKMVQEIDSSAREVFSNHTHSARVSASFQTMQAAAIKLHADCDKYIRATDFARISLGLLG